MNHQSKSMHWCWIILLLAIIVSACSVVPNTTATSVPTAITITPKLPTVISTSTLVSPSSTPTFTPTTTPETPTPYPPLSAVGPYWLFETFPNDQNIFTLLNADGSGRQLLNVPQKSRIPNLRSAVSPDGNWLVFYTGSVDEAHDLTLNILNIRNGTSRTIARLLTDGYPDNLSLLVTALPTVRPDFDKEAVDWIGPVKSAFDNGLFAFAWSPDGRHLAFAGQLDGPSSDLYVLDIETNHIQRLTDDLQSLLNIRWSPDMQRIVYENSIPGQIYQGATLHAVKSDGTSSKHPRSLENGFWWTGQGWLSAERYLLANVGDGGPHYDLRDLNIETGQLTSLWPDVFEGYAVDQENGLVALSTVPSGYSFADPKPHAEDGLYFIDFSGNRQKVSNIIFWRLLFRGGTVSRFIGFDGNTVATISKDGAITVVSQRTEANAKISPDNQWFVIFNSDGFDLYNDSDQLVNTFSGSSISDIVWRPDSTGFLAMNYNELYYVPVAMGKPKLVDLCPPRECEFHGASFVWLP